MKNGTFYNKYYQRRNFLHKTKSYNLKKISGSTTKFFMALTKKNIIVQYKSKMAYD